MFEECRDYKIKIAPEGAIFSNRFYTLLTSEGNFFGGLFALIPSDADADCHIW